MKRVAIPQTSAEADEVLSQDLLWGISAIADYTKLTNRQASYLIETKRLPARKLGGRIIVARKSEIDAALSARTVEGGEA
jgi:hypothetical protein